MDSSSDSSLDPEEMEYKMNHPRRGIAIIFQHYKYNENLNILGVRHGSEVDMRRLNKNLTDLGFEIKVHEDKTVSEVTDIINKVAEDIDHSDCDCLTVFLFTHGNANGCVYARDAPYSVQQLWSPFTAKKCPSLIGKPKLFFIQACRGNAWDSGCTVQTDAANTSEEQPCGECDAYTKPTRPDFFVLYSSVEGFISYRDFLKGTWFVQSLCNSFETLIPKTDLLTIATHTIAQVAFKYTAAQTDDKGTSYKKQVPQLHSTLRKKVYFHAKPSSQKEAGRDTLVNDDSGPDTKNNSSKENPGHPMKKDDPKSVKKAMENVNEVIRKYAKQVNQEGNKSLEDGIVELELSTDEPSNLSDDESDDANNRDEDINGNRPW